MTSLREASELLQRAGEQTLLLVRDGQRLGQAVTHSAIQAVSNILVAVATQPSNHSTDHSNHVLRRVVENATETLHATQHVGSCF